MIAIGTFYFKQSAGPLNFALGLLPILVFRPSEIFTEYWSGVEGLLVTADQSSLGRFRRVGTFNTGVHLMTTAPEIPVDNAERMYRAATDTTHF